MNRFPVRAAIVGLAGLVLAYAIHSETLLGIAGLWLVVTVGFWAHHRRQLSGGELVVTALQELSDAADARQAPPPSQPPPNPRQQRTGTAT